MALLALSQQLLAVLVVLEARVHFYVLAAQVRLVKVLKAAQIQVVLVAALQAVVARLLKALT